MAATNDTNLSEYASLLDAESKKRYVSKIQLIDGKDPYNIGKEEWSKDIVFFPNITYPDVYTYLVHTKSPYTHQDLKSYKSLEAYGHVTSGWVRDVSSYNHSANMMVIQGKVST